MNEFDVVVLGGSLSGTSAALRAAELGGKVGLVENKLIGEKGFMRRNLLLTERRSSIDFEPVSWVHQTEMQNALAGIYCKKIEKKLSETGIVVLNGEGNLAGPKEILVQNSGGSQIIMGKSLILAYGSEPSFSSTLPQEDNVIISIDEIPLLKEIPEKVLVIGGGTSGSQAALGFQELGCKVFLCTSSEEIFPEMDPEFNSKIEAQLKKRKIKILHSKKIISFYKNGADLEITLETGIKFTTHLIVLMDERKGCPPNKDAKNMGIRLGAKDEILVDDRMMTSLPGVYGVGSISGKLLSDAMSQEQGRVAAENAMGKKRQLNCEWVPEISRLIQNAGYVGCSMKTAPHQGFHPIEGISEHEIYWEGDATTVETFKIVADKRSKMIVGAQIISNHAAELIPMILLLIKKGVTVGNLANSVSSEMTRFQGICMAARACLQAIKSQ